MKIDKSSIIDFKRSKKYGYWTGSYRLTPLDEWAGWGLWKRRLYLFENIDLTFHHPQGYKIRPDKKFKTDMGSVPLFLQSLIPVLFAKDRWLREYIMHDSAYAHGGLWVALNGCEDYTFLKMQRPQVDDLLSLTIKAGGGSCVSSGPIWLGVRAGGWASFKKGDLRKAA